MFSKIFDNAAKNTNDAFNDWLCGFDFDLMAESYGAIAMTAAPYNRVESFISAQYKELCQMIADYDVEKVEFVIDYSSAPFGRARATCFLSIFECGIDNHLFAEFSITRPEFSTSCHSDLMQVCYRFCEIVGVGCRLNSAKSGARYYLNCFPKNGGFELNLSKIN